MCTKLLCDDSRCLREPLKEWLVPVQEQRQQHPAYIETEYLVASDFILWIRHQDRYIQCTQIQPGMFQETNDSTEWANIPASSVPVQVYYEDQGIWRITATSIPRSPPPAQPTSTFDQYLCLLPEWEYELLKFVEFLRILSQSLVSSNTRACELSVMDPFGRITTARLVGR